MESLISQPSDTNGPGFDRLIFAKLRRGLIAAATFSAVINLLALSSPLYMMQVYDRVLTSKSMSTLLLLSLIFGGLLVLMGVLDALRGQLLARLGGMLEHAYGPRLLRYVLDVTGKEAAGNQPLEDLRGIRTVLQGQSITALFDLPCLRRRISNCVTARP